MAGGQVYLNGAFVDRERAVVPVDDRGFVFGDGVYEVTRAVNGRLFELDRHLNRLRRSLGEIRIVVPMWSSIDWAKSGTSWYTAMDSTRGMPWCTARSRAALHRGRIPFPPATVTPTLYSSATAFAVPAAVRARGARGIMVPDLRWARCNIKTVTLLPNVLARQQAVEAGADEAFFVRDGVVLEGRLNLFAVVDGALWTHPYSGYISPGVTREVVLELAHAAGLPVELRPILLEDLPRATELFLTGTATNVMPIVAMDGRTIGSGKPGPVAAQLYAALAARLES